MPLTLDPRRPLRLAATLVLSASLALSGCVTLPTEAQLAATRDECSRFRAPFVAIAQARNARIEGWAKVGGSAGSLLGANIARNRGDNILVGGLVGGLIGAAAGAAAGYASDLQRRASTTDGLQRAIASDASRDLREADALVNNLTSLNNCRLRQIAAVERSVRGGGDRGTARAAIAGIRTNVGFDNRIVGGVVGDLTRTRNVYIGALRQTGADTSTFVSSIQAYQPRVSTPQRTALRIDRGGRPRTNNSIARLGYAEKELSAGARAHVQSVDARISAVNDLLV